jgi:hypothetical protein
MILEVSRHLLACVETSLELSVSDVASYDDCALEVNACANRILRKLCTYSVDTLVEVDLDASCALARTTEFLRNKFRRISVHLLEEHTVLSDLSLDVAVSRAANAHTDWAACAVAWQTDYADVVSEILAAELCAETDLVSLLEELLFEVDVAEGASSLVACCRQRVVVLDRSELHGEEVLLSRCATDNECDVVRRTSRCTEALHLLYEEGEQGALVLDGSLGHRVEVCLVGRATAFSHHYEAILVALYSLDVDLCREVAACVHLVVHVQRSVLRVAQVVFGEGVVHTA